MGRVRQWFARVMGPSTSTLCLYCRRNPRIQIADDDRYCSRVCQEDAFVRQATSF